MLYNVYNLFTVSLDSSWNDTDEVLIDRQF